MHADQVYIQALLNNDAVLIDDIYKKYAEKIKWMVLKNNGNEDDAADLFQDALIDLCRTAKNGFVLQCPLDAFLYVVCRNKWITTLKKRKTLPVTFTDTERYNIIADTDTSDEILQKIAERKKLLKEKMMLLGESCREILELCWKGIGMQEVADTLHVSYAYARKRKSECIGKLTNLVQQSQEYKDLQW